MKYLGIDFGTKRVGLAVGEDTTFIATPSKVLPNDKNLLEEVLTFCDKEKIGCIVIGESKDFQMKDNPVMVAVNSFKEELLKKIKYSGTRGGNACMRKIWSPDLLKRIECEYIEKFGSVEATYQVFFCKARQ